MDRGIITRTSTLYGGDAADEEYIRDISDSVRAVEKLLHYPFKDKKILEDALTHSSYVESASYQRLEFLGDAALGLLITNFLFLSYPDFNPGELSLLRSANISTEKLARIAVRHGLHRYVRHNTTSLDHKVKEFAMAVQEEDGTVVYGGEMKAPKVLADIVESVIGAVYVDCGFDLHALWLTIRDLLEPIVVPEILQKQPQPVTTLFELCQKDGRQVNIEHWRNGEKDIASVYVDGKLIASASSEQKENAKLRASMAALEKLCVSESNCKMDIDYKCIDGTTEIEGAKHILHSLCTKKRWPKPCYRIVGEFGPLHGRRYTYSVEIETVNNVLFVEGEEKPRVRDAKNSAASLMIRGLQDSKYE